MTATDFVEIAALKGCDLNGVFFIVLIPYAELQSVFTPLRSSPTLDTKEIRKHRKTLSNKEHNFNLPLLTAATSHNLAFTSITENLGKIKLPTSKSLLLISGRELCIAAMTHEDRSRSITPAICVRIIDQVPAATIAELAESLTSKQSKAARIVGSTFDAIADLSVTVVDSVRYFGELVERDKTSISNRSAKLLTLSSIYEANRELLNESAALTHEEQVRFAIEFWTIVGESLPQWNLVLSGEITPSVCRQQYVHTHGLMIRAIARIGCRLAKQKPKTWTRYIRKLAEIDFSRTNRQWSGVAIVQNKISKSLDAIARTETVLERLLAP